MWSVRRGSLLLLFIVSYSPMGTDIYFTKMLDTTTDAQVTVSRYGVPRADQGNQWAMVIQ